MDRHDAKRIVEGGRGTSTETGEPRGLSLEGLRADGQLRPIDLQLADFVRRATGTDDPALLLAAALTSRAVGDGQACLDLAAHAGQALPDATEAAPDARGSESAPVGGSVPTLPPLSVWLAALRTDAARRLVGGADDRRPFVLAGSRLYLRRYWTYERTVASGFARLAAQDDTGAPWPDWFETRLRQYFPDGHDGTALQREAARKACRRQLSILSGGPGTGKTYTLARIVALLAELQPAEAPLRVRVAAPTGKAATRVVESLRKAKHDLVGTAPDPIVAQVPETAETLHRLLGTVPNSPYFRHDRDHPLDADVIVVDEASMVDLPLMAKLLDAMPAACRLVLVGDRDQLASVEPGRVYGDLCEAAGRSEALRGCLTQLTHSRRFGSGTAIGRLADAINAGSSDAWHLLCDASGTGVAAHGADVALDEDFRATVTAGYGNYLEASEPAQALRAAGEFRVLCATRRGPVGVYFVNRLIEQALAKGHGHGVRRFSPTAPFYDHRLVMVTVNDYSLGLYNGDVGVVLRETGGEALRAWFEGGTASDAGGCRSVPVHLLPDHETAFAMTVHKSQGSEFERVALVLPPEADSPVLTRELLYTGITRTRSHLDLWCTEAPFMAAVRRRTQRSSGLFTPPVTEQRLDAGGYFRLTPPSID